MEDIGRSSQQEGERGGSLRKGEKEDRGVDLVNIDG